MIEINNLTTLQINEEFLKKVATIVLESESASRRKKEVDLSVALVGQGRIRKLNKRYRGKNRATDVLAFGENEIPNSTPKIPKTIKGLGEVIICLREVKKNARRFGSTFEKELGRVLIHGILHLLGYDHEESEEKAQKMKKKEEYYLSRT